MYKARQQPAETNNYQAWMHTSTYTAYRYPSRCCVESLAGPNKVRRWRRRRARTPTGMPTTYTTIIAAQYTANPYLAHQCEQVAVDGRVSANIHVTTHDKQNANSSLHMVS
jgi:hypothetical protein